MTGGTIAGIIISDQILGRHSPWAHAYSPSRLAPPLRDPGVVGAEVAHMARGYAEALLPRSTRDLKGAVCCGRQLPTAAGSAMMTDAICARPPIGTAQCMRGGRACCSTHQQAFAPFLGSFEA